MKLHILLNSECVANSVVSHCYRHFLSAVIFLTTTLSTYQTVVAIRLELCTYLSLIKVA